MLKMAAPTMSDKRTKSKSKKNKIANEDEGDSLRYFVMDARNGNGEDTEVDDPESVSTSTRDYLCQIETVLDCGFQDEDDKDLFITNVFNSIDGEEVLVAENSDTSRVLEKILRVCNDGRVAHYVQRISENLVGLCGHRCGSHVVQTLLEVLHFNGQSKPISVTDENVQKQSSTGVKFIEKLVEIICDNIEELIIHQYASHVICSLLDVLSQTKVSAKIHQSKKSHRTFPKKNDHKKDESSLAMISSDSTVNKKFKSHLKRLVKAVRHLDLQSLIKDPHSSTVLQTILLALFSVNADSCERFVATLIVSFSSSSSEEETEDNSIVLNATDRNCAHLIEQIIEVSSPKLYEKLAKETFKGKLNELALNSCANFVVQRLVKHCPSKPLFEQMYSELEDGWSAIANEGHFGILTCLSEACVRLNACQVKFVANLVKLLKCGEPNERRARLVLFIAYLTSYEEWESLTEQERSVLKVNYHGSILFQNLLRFQNTHQIVNNLLDVSADDLKSLFCDPYGSFIMDAFATSDKVSSKSRCNFIMHLKDGVVDFACDKYGSRCLEAIWRAGDAKQKKLIIEKLADNEERLRSNQIGAYALNTYAVSLFKRKPEEWADWQAKGDRKRKMFEDFFVTATDKKMKEKD